VILGVLVLLTATQAGCAMSLASARGGLRAATASPATCDVIDREHSIATTLAGVFGGLAGANGLASIPVHDGDVRSTLMGAATASGVGAAAMGIWSQDRAERFERVCR
jgi:hypothetical protein